MADNTPERQLMSDAQISIANRLKRLQAHNRSNIPAMMSHKAMSSFTLQEEQLPDEAIDEVSVIVYPQDPFIGDPEVRTMKSADIQPGLVNSRVRIQDSAGASAQPDEAGNYMYWPGTNEFDQVNSFYYTTFTLRMFERYARRSLPWSFPSPRISIDPHVAGNFPNAFYDEDEHRLGFHSFVVENVAVNASQSADVVSHECAHAVLDGLRDLHNESFGLGPMAFHESFGDMAAILVAMHDDSLIQRLLDWTDGDLRLSNFVSSLAEHLTETLIQASEGRVHGHTVYLRNALNALKCAPFEELPYMPDNPETELGLESHNYSRLFTGAFYDIIVGIYEHLRSRMPPRIALHRTRDIVGHVLVCAVELGPVGEFNFSDMARAFITADSVLYDGQHIRVMRVVFDERGLLSQVDTDAHTASLRMLPDIQLPNAINTSLAAALFLEETVLPTIDLPDDIELVPVNVYRNADGNAYLAYFSHRRMELHGKQFRRFDGAYIDVFGGLTLMFDHNSNLRSVFYRPVTDEDQRQIRALVHEMVARELIVEQIQPAIRMMLHSPPKGLFLQDDPLISGQRPEGMREGQLIKFPVVFDDVSGMMSDFSAYIRQWQQKLP